MNLDDQLNKSKESAELNSFSADFLERIIEYKEVMEAYLMTGEADYLLRIVVKDLQTYEKFLKENLTRIPGISSIRSYFSLKQVTRKYNLPIINPKSIENKHEGY